MRKTRYGSAVWPYISTYFSAPSVQDADAATTDRQMGAILGFLLGVIQHGDTIYDIGCGNGILLSALAGARIQPATTDWSYVGVDGEHRLAALQATAAAKKFANRIRLIDGNHLTPVWPLSSGRRIIFLRNVLHELSISQTAEMFCAIMRNFRLGDLLVLQDLETLPQAERGNTCWTSRGLAQCLERQGYVISRNWPGTSPAGDQWFNIVAQRHVIPSQFLSIEEMLALIMCARYRQWYAWRLQINREATQKSGRPNHQKSLDRDLQWAALSRNLPVHNRKYIEMQFKIETRIRRRRLDESPQHSMFRSPNRAKLPWLDPRALEFVVLPRAAVGTSLSP